MEINYLLNGGIAKIPSQLDRNWSAYANAIQQSNRAFCSPQIIRAYAMALDVRGTAQLKHMLENFWNAAIFHSNAFSHFEM